MINRGKKIQETENGGEKIQKGGSTCQVSVEGKKGKSDGAMGVLSRGSNLFNVDLGGGEKRNCFMS